MELIRGLHNLRPRHRGCVATIGAFDGLHKGHQRILEHLKAEGRQRNLPTTVIVFEPLPREYFAPVRSPARLMSFREKFIALRELGVDRVLRIRFDDRFSRLSADEFIRQVFVDGLDIRFMMAGDDLRFGHDREGDYQVLKAAGSQWGFEVTHADTCEVDGERVSSTRIRKALEAGDFVLAERLLGRPYAISGKVVYGQQLGRTLGAPTANLQLHRLRAAMSGVYAVDVAGLGEALVPGVANVGTRPTVNDSVKAILEVHLLDFDRTIYGKRIDVFFRKKMRDEHKFDSLDALKAQIGRDIAAAYDWFGLHQ